MANVSDLLDMYAQAEEPQLEAQQEFGTEVSGSPYLGTTPRWDGGQGEITSQPPAQIPEAAPSEPDTQAAQQPAPQEQPFMTRNLAMGDMVPGVKLPESNKPYALNQAPAGGSGIIYISPQEAMRRTRMNQQLWAIEDQINNGQLDRQQGRARQRDIQSQLNPLLARQSASQRQQMGMQEQQIIRQRALQAWAGVHDSNITAQALVQMAKPVYTTDENGERRLVGHMSIAKISPAGEITTRFHPHREAPAEKKPTYDQQLKQDQEQAAQNLEPKYNEPASRKGPEFWNEVTKIRDERKLAAARQQAQANADPGLVAYHQKLLDTLPRREDGTANVEAAPIDVLRVLYDQLHNPRRLGQTPGDAKKMRERIEAIVRDRAARKVVVPNPAAHLPPMENRMPFIGQYRRMTEMMPGPIGWNMPER